jgi:hypothetical protein
MASSDQPGGTGGPPLTPPYLALLRAGFTWHPTSPPNPVSSYLTLSPLPAVAGGLLSVALSLGLPPLDVIQRLALRSPDFPPLHLQRRPSVLLQPILKTLLALLLLEDQNPLAMWTKVQLVALEERVVELGRQLHIAAQA